MCSTYSRLAALLVALGLVFAVCHGVPVTNQDLSEEFENRKYERDVKNIEDGVGTRQLDKIGGGNILGQPSRKNNTRNRRQIDPLAGSSFGNNVAKRYDSLSGGSFGTSKRNFDEMDRTPFDSFNKKNLDEIDRAGFNSFVKKKYDEFDRLAYLNNYLKRASPGLARYYQAEQGY